MDDHARAMAFERRVLEATSTRIEPFPWGAAFFNDDYPNYYDGNLVWVDRPLRGVGVDRLAAEVDGTMLGFGHREVRVPDDADGGRVAIGLAELGYSGDHLMVMALRREPDRQGRVDLVDEVDHPTIRPFLIETTIGEAWGTPSVAEELADYRRVLVEGAGCRFFLQRVDGRIAGACELYARAGIAQVESVVTLDEFRGRGVASNVVLRAVGEAMSGGATLVFLVADLNDWPHRLYGRLGFDEIGRSWSFLRSPEAGSSA